jgi:hypothetical protein
MTGTCCDATDSTYVIVVLPTPNEAEAEYSASRLLTESVESFSSGSKNHLGASLKVFLKI